MSAAGMSYGLSNPYEVGAGDLSPRFQVRSRVVLRLVALGGVGAGLAGLQVLGAGAAQADPVSDSAWQDYRAGEREAGSGAPPPESEPYQAPDVEENTATPKPLPPVEVPVVEVPYQVPDVEENTPTPEPAPTLPPEPEPIQPIRGARCLAALGDSVTTDHISPAGSIQPGSPAGQYLMARGVDPPDFNSYGSRRGNHEVMMRGTFANVRLKNRLVPGVEGGVTLHLPDGEQMPIFDAAMKYSEEGVPLIVLAGKEYGSGSSRDWAAKGPLLLGIRAVIAESYERIHRSNLVGMGIMPLEFKPGESVTSLGLTGYEVLDVGGLAERLESGFKGGRDITVRAKQPDGKGITFTVTVRIDTPNEVLYYRHGGILHYVLRKLLES